MAPSFILKDVKIPVDLISDPGAFGGEPEHDCMVGDLWVEHGEAMGLLSPKEARPTLAVYEADGTIILPKFVDVHCHLDKCHTIERLGPVGGDLKAAIEAQYLDKEYWTANDLEFRARRAIEEYLKAGCSIIRSHVDWEDDTPLAWNVLGKLTEEYADRILIQRAALTSIDQFSEDKFGETVAKIVAAAGGVLGVYILDQPTLSENIKHVFAVAQKYQLDLDFHVDEGLTLGLNGVEVIARTAIETGFRGNILCGHVSSMMNKTGEELEAVLGLIKDSGISIASLPNTNLYLQGREDGTPNRRGITRIREFDEAGVPVAIGADNVGDAFCPLGRHDPLYSLSMGILVAHLDPPFSKWLKCITIDAERALGLPPTFVDGAAVNKLLKTNAKYTAELIANGEAAPCDLASYLAEKHFVKVS